jgi:hypothetical protein
MTPARDNLDEALRAVLAGDLDALAPEQVARLEGVMNEAPAVAVKLAGLLPARDERLVAVLQDMEYATAPPARAWDAAWERIDGTGPIAKLAQRRAGVARILRLWKPLAAAAACLLLAVLWRVSTAAPIKPWPMQLASDVEINQLEVNDGMTPFVVSTGGDGGVQVIWVLPDQS